MKTRVLVSALAVVAVLVCLSAAAQDKEKCKRLQQEVDEALDRWRTAAEEAQRNPGKDNDAAAAKLRQDLVNKRKKLKACQEQPAGAATAGDACADSEKKLSDAISDQKVAGSSGASGKEMEKAEHAVHDALLAHCKCLKDRGVHPLPDSCLELGVGAQIAGGDASQCDQKKKDFEEANNNLKNGAGLVAPETKTSESAAKFRDLQGREAEAREKYCDCLKKMNLPLVWPCEDYIPAVRGRSDAPRTAAPPPPSPRTPPSPPPSKTAAPPPPPPPKTVPPPPPSSSAVPPPSGSSSSNFMCGKAVCDCMKQSPPKVCKAGSGCACTKG